MKILHTSDVHLREFDDERWEALTRILALGRAEKIGLLLVSGDLFDSKAAADRLHPRVQALFDSSGFETILLPGNHDREAYPEGSYFGANVHVIESVDRPVRLGGVRTWGLPFDDLREEEILGKLRGAAGAVDAETVNILLFHGELLDVSGDWRNYGEEGERRYMPVKLHYFTALPWDYILAGHFHTRFTVRQIRDGAFFVYPGSPVSVSRKETGQRGVNLFETGGPPGAKPLGTRYFHEMEISLGPFQENPLERLKAEVDSLPKNARILLEIGGYFDGSHIGLSEKELVEAVKKTVEGRCEDPKFAIRDIREILDDELLRWFSTRLEEKSLGEERARKIRDTAIRAMMEMSR